jgi:hypothetical protein
MKERSWPGAGRKGSKRRRHRLVGVVVALFGLGVAAGSSAPSAIGHWCCFSEPGVTIDRWISSNTALFSSNVHSWTFVSANDITTPENAYVCPAITGPPSPYDHECGFDFERYCWWQNTHDGSDLNCHDADGNAWKWIVENASDPSGSSIFRIHAVY